MSVIEKLEEATRRMKAETVVLYLAARHPKTPWYAKMMAAVVMAYALSPIDLIPDFVPVLGYLDDLILVPAGIALVIRWIPEPVLEECRSKATEWSRDGHHVSWVAGGVIVAIWLMAAAVCIRWVWGWWQGEAVTL